VVGRTVDLYPLSILGRHPMSAALARSRDRAVSWLRLLGLVLLLLGLTLTRALAGVFARETTAEGGASAATAETGAAPHRRTAPAASAGQVLVVVHRLAGPAEGTAPLAATAAPAPPAPAAPVPEAPTVSAPTAPVEPAGTSSGSDPG